MRLSPDTLATLAAQVDRPRYDPAAQAIGIVHLGIGAFHRAHQAVYTDDALNAGDRDWRIAGVSLRSADVYDQLAAQQGLYTVTDRSGAGERTRLIGAVDQVRVAPHDSAAVVTLLAAPTTGLVTLTVTEKGYRQASDGGLDLDAADLRGELAGGSPTTIYGYLARALAVRQSQGAGGLTLLSCDNLAENGRTLARLLTAYLDRTDPALGDWVTTHCAFPSSMVDRIVPATTAEDRARLAGRIGVDDAGAVFTEPFRQWVIEDRFATRRPAWDAGGAEFVRDVRPYEAAKLRMLNGAHSALAYIGLEHGHSFVHEAVADPAIAPLVETLMLDEAAASLRPAPGQDLRGYAEALRTRFANPALAHRLEQIAMDGSQKIPQRWLHTLAHHQAQDRACPAILRALAAWLRHVRGDVRAVSDPMAPRLAALWAEGGAETIVDALFGARGIFAAEWTATPDNRTLLLNELARLSGSDGAPVGRA